ncbi:MAG: CAP domain-containing protein [Verrucomicrobiota bacterium]|nr:CAP domain-containing protein [Verrucomicrobiota bacterium]
MLRRSFLLVAFGLFALAPFAFAQTQYSIGNPSNEQQYMIELINRARVNGAAEAARTGLSGLQEGSPTINGQTWTIQNANQPLSWNPQLATAAQNHATNLNNADQFFLGVSPHTFGGTTPAQRIAAAGYNAAPYTGRTTAGGSYPGEENVSEAVTQGSGSFSGAKLIQGVLDAHNGLFVDTTVPGRGHRSTMMLEFYREAGVGISAGTDNQTNPGQPGGPWDSLYIVENFGTAAGSTPFITGVVYNDANGNGVYDPGDGIGGVRVDVAGANFFAITTASGGYSVPVPANGTYAVTFSGGGVPTTQRSATVASNLNAKLDLTAAVSSIALESISTRARVGLNDDVIIGGFAIRGAGQKRILVRGLGPVLANPPFNVPNVLANPTLTILQGQTPLASNDDWASGPNAQELVALGKQPPKSAESALIISLPAGDYTAQVRGVNNTTGAGLVQIYDLDPASSPKLDSISTRGVVGVDDDVMIGGVNLQGAGTQKVVFRAIGPSLAQFGVANTLANPYLRVADANGNTVAEKR